MESAAMRETPATPIDGNSKEAIGAISRAYRDIFTSCNNSCPERPAKRANVNITNNSTYRFSQDSTFPQVSTQPISTQTYQSCPVAPAPLCPVAPNNNQHAFHNGDNNQYTYPVSTNQSHTQSNNATHQKSNSGSESCIQNAANIPNQHSCPWKLAPGAKVLVRKLSIWHHVKFSVKSFKQVLTVLSFLKACPLNAWPVSGAERTSQEIWESFSQCFTPAVKEVVEFAKGIPGFQELSQQDQVMLLKSGTFQVITHYLSLIWSSVCQACVTNFVSVFFLSVLFVQVLMVRFSTLFNAQKHTVTFLNGQTYSLSTLRAFGMGSLLDAMFEFSEKLASLNLEPDEMALFMAVVLVSAGKNMDQILRGVTCCHHNSSTHAGIHSVPQTVLASQTSTLWSSYKRAWPVPCAHW